MCAPGAPCGQPAPLPPTSPNLRTWLEAKRADACPVASASPGPPAERVTAREQKAAAWHAEWRRKTEEVSDEESRQGRCDSERLATLQRTIHGRQRLTSAVDHSRVLALVAHRILPATAEGAQFRFDSAIGGAIHVFVLGYSPPALSTSDSHGDESQLRSDFGLHWPEFPDDEFSVHLDEELRSHKIRLGASRLVQMNGGEPLTVRVTGKGCALVAVYHEL